MKLSFLLFGLGLKLRISLFFNKSFRKKIRYNDGVIAIRTADRRHAHSYIFKRNIVWSRFGVNKKATVELIWSDAETAMNAMLSSEPLDTFTAIGNGSLVIEGDLQDALWFMDVAESIA